MPIKTEQLKRGFILVLTDVSSNSLRNWMRRKMRKEWHALPKTQSCYLIPVQVGTKEQLELWGRENKVEIIVFGLDLEEKELISLEAQYKQALHDDIKELDMWIEEIWKNFIETEENIDDPKKGNLSGLYKKIQGVETRFDDIYRVCNRVGDPHKEFRLQGIQLWVEKLKSRLERLRAMKARKVEEE